jgi:hypothetical protein
MKYISFSLWGNNPKYTTGAIKNLELAQQIYPEWTCKFYVANDVPKNIINVLSAKSKVVLLKNSGNWKLAVERFKTIDETDAEYVIFRDTDSRLSIREKIAVDQWIESGKTLHIMKDHPNHNGFPILAGMWGLNKQKFNNNINNMLNSYNNIESYHYDQIFLANYIWNLYSNDCLIHDDFYFGKKFTTKRVSGEFIGQVYDENDIPHQQYKEILVNYLNNKENK